MTPVFALLALSAAAPTFNEQVGPLLHEKCAGCHRPGQSAPFSLLSFEDAKKRGALIAGVTATRYMPPWQAEPASFTYRDSRRLTDAQITLLKDWVKAGMPEGNPKNKPTPPRFNDGWQLGEPDLVVELPEAFEVPADGPDLYRNLVIPVGLSEEKYLRAIELQPTARQVVHHVLLFADPAPRKVDSKRMGMPVTATTVSLGGWAVGSQPHFLPEGLAMTLPKGADLVFQYHFHPIGKPMKEKTRVGLYFSKEPPKRSMATVQLPPLYSVFEVLKIQPGETKEVRESFTLPVDVEAVSVGAHAHYIGKTMKLTATLPNGDQKVLLDIKDWDFAWQDRYFFEQFVPLPKGTKLEGVVSWDNTAANRRNPSKEPKLVTWGEQSEDEMGSVGILLVPTNEADIKELRDASRRSVRNAAIKAFQKDPGYLMGLRDKFGGAGAGLLN